MDEYKALIFGLEATRKMAITHISIYGDLEFIMEKIKCMYQTKHPKMRAYRNQVWDLIENFFHAFNIITIPREINQKEYPLAVK